MTQRDGILKLEAARIAIKNNQRHAPEALAGNAPVRASRDHFAHAFAAPCREPFHFFDFLEGAGTQRRCFRRGDRGGTGIHLNKPLLGGAENHRIVAAPAMRIAVRDFLLADEHVALLQQLDDDGIRFEHSLALVFRQAFDEAAVVVLRGVGFQPIFLASPEVVRAVAWSGVHDAAALIERHVIGEYTGNLRIEKRMLEQNAFEFRAFPSRVHCVNFDVQFGLQRIHALFRQEQFPGRGVRHDVFVVRVKRQSAIRGQRPRRSGPDQGADVAIESQRFRFFPSDYREPHPDGRTGVVLVFHFGFSQRGAVENAPVHGLQAAVDVTFLVKIEKRAGDGCLIACVHREIRPVPLA